METPLPTDEVIDHRPIALRRKRRTGVPGKDGLAVIVNHVADARRPPRKISKPTTVSTPRKKRVRFSDPGPEVLPMATGLTPALNRYCLGPNSPSCTDASPRRKQRRHSSPLKQSSVTSPLMGTLQFEPLRQVIDGRSKRRLRRNHLSEEMNKIEEERKLEERVDRVYFAMNKKQIDNRGTFGEWGLHISVPKGSCTKDVHDLNRLSGRSTSMREGPSSLHQKEFEFDRLSTTSTIDLGLGSADVERHAPSENVAASEFFNDTDPREVADKGIQAERTSPEQAELEDQIRELRESLQVVTSELEVSTTKNQRLVSKIRAHLQDQGSSFSSNASEVDSALDNVLTSLVLAQSRADDAEIGLSTLSSEIKGLGFEGENVEDTLNAISQQFRQARLELEYLEPGETVQGFENATLLGLLVDRVRLLMQRMRDSAEDQEKHHQVATVLRDQFDRSEAELAISRARVLELTHDVEEKERSISNLQRALDGYRLEVQSLERLVNRLESEHAKVTQGLQKAMDEAVADLEGKLDGEIKSKAEIVREVEEKRSVLKDLQSRFERGTELIETLRQEKDTILAEKDDMVAKLHVDSAEKDNAHELQLSKQGIELECLKREKSTLVESLAEAEISIGTLVTANTTLEGRLTSDLEAGMRAMEAMQTEMMRSLARVAEIKNTYLNSGKINVDDDGAALPATPCSLRFRNTPKKKKRKVDSGIGVLEEDALMFDV